MATSASVDQILKALIQECSAADLSLVERLNLVDGYIGAIIDLRRYRNSLVPIASLPDDILVDVMSWFITEEDTYVVMDMQWATSTCHRWRAVALSTPRLWTNINLSKLSHPSTEEFIQRSRSSPLCIYYKTNWATTPMDRRELATFISANFSRVQKIMRLMVPQKIILQILSYFGSYAAPYLEAITLENKNNDGSSVRTLRAVNSQTPSLRRVCFRNVPISFGSPMFHNLTSLSVTQMWHTPTDVVLGALACSPELRELSLVLIAPDPEHTPHTISPLDRLLHFPNLILLNLSACADILKRLLTHLRFPNVTHLSFKAKFTDNDTAENFISALFPTHLPSTNHFRDLNLHGGDYGGVRFHNEIEDSSRNWSFQASSIDRNAYPITRQILSRVSELFPLQFITTLFVEFNYSPILSNEWVQTLALFPTLTTLHVGNLDYCHVLCALQSPIADGEPDILCPQLLVLVLNRVQYEWNDGSASMMSTEISSCLASRAAQGAASLLTLELDSHSIKLDLDELQMYVPNIVVNGSKVRPIASHD